MEEQSPHVYNLKLGITENFSPEEIEKTRTSLGVNSYSSLYELQKSASDWSWYDFSWFSDELKYRQIIYNNSVPIYRLKTDDS